MATNTNADLIVSKTAEYSKLPGLILGLDGWILRSLPVEHRAQFLHGYEKLLRIVFHPDRYQDPAKKESRQSYLQSVGEAVEYMLSDEFSYEMTAETVPSHKNPIVALREAVAVRDGIIKRADNLKSKAEEGEHSAKRELTDAMRRIAKAESELQIRTSQHYQLNRCTEKMVRKYPVPITSPSAKVSGRFINFRNGTQIDSGSDHCIERSMAAYSSSSYIDECHEWISQGSWITIAETQGILSTSDSLTFHHAACEGRAKWRIVGAMTIAHLCEYARTRSGYREKIRPSEFVESINAMNASRPKEENIDEHERPIKACCVSFYAPGMILVLRCSDKYRLLIVDSVDASDKPNKVAIEHWRKKYYAAESLRLVQKRKMREQVCLLKNKLRDAKAKAKPKATHHGRDSQPPAV